MKRTTFEDLAKIITDEYVRCGRRSLDRLEDSLQRLRAVFGDTRVITITLDRLTAYVRGRMEQGAAVSTIRKS